MIWQMQRLSIVCTFYRKNLAHESSFFYAMWFCVQLCSVVDKYTCTTSLDFKGAVTPNFCALICIFVNITKAVQE